MKWRRLFNPELLQLAQAQERDVCVRSFLCGDFLRGQCGAGEGIDAATEDGRANRSRTVSGE